MGHEVRVDRNDAVRRTRWFAIVALCLLAPWNRAHAQRSDPDMHAVRPIVMLLVDTSGSMEYRAGVSSSVEPVCTGLPGSERSRWATVLEALTGRWPNYTCDRVDRRAAYPGAPDQYYFLPHYRPPSTTQDLDGVLDTYGERVRFGLMTFDTRYGISSARGSELMVEDSLFRTRLTDNEGAPGDYSYGEPRELTFPGCTTSYIVDGGARNDNAPAGRLVSVGDEFSDYRTVNGLIQTQLLATRPYGATPTAAMLDDLRFYLANHPDVAPGVSGDPWAACRPRYAILLTDGQPTDPFRESIGCNQQGYICPYSPPGDIAADLCRFDSDVGESGECTGNLDGLYVVGVETSDADIVSALDDLADRGGTRHAYITSDYGSLIESLAAVLNNAAEDTTTRTAPSVFSTSIAGAGTQYRVNSGFVIPLDDDGSEPWSGVLDRTRFECDSDLVPQEQPLDPDRDSFHEILNERDLAGSPRRLLTVTTSDPADMRGTILGAEGAGIASLSPCTTCVGPGVGAGGGGGGSYPLPTVASGLGLSDFSEGASALTAAHFGITTGTSSEQDALRRDIINWVHGESGTPREGNRFGDIYHSTPAVVSAPRFNTSDEWFNAFRRFAPSGGDPISSRPSVVYVGTNDGILHAFAGEDIDYNGDEIPEGTELWGFVPPALVPRLSTSLNAHQILVDGTPIVRDVYYARTSSDTPTANRNEPDAYRTVLVMGLRAGGNVYFALDITDPMAPRFLWQFTDQYMGQTYARPAIAQIAMNIGGTRQTRAVAILPGGMGEIDTVRATANGVNGCPAQSSGDLTTTDDLMTTRSAMKCWNRAGRSVYWVDVATGRLIYSFTHDTFSSPMTGGVALYQGSAGGTATQAYVTDQDGVIWRLDFSRPRPTDWSVQRLHDLFWDAGPTEGQPAYNQPVLSTDRSGNVVLLQGTGDPDQLDVLGSHRVVSLTQQLSFDSSGINDVETSVNWEVRLRPSEQMTTGIDLYNGVTYFGTFEAAATSDACEYGVGRIWAVDYLQGDTSAPAGYSQVLDFPLPRTLSEDGNPPTHYIGPYHESVPTGLAVSQQATCTRGTPDLTTYARPRYRVTAVGEPRTQLVVQLSGSGAPRTSTETSVGTMVRQLARPESETRVMSWLPRVEE